MGFPILYFPVKASLIMCHLSRHLNKMRYKPCHYSENKHCKQREQQIQSLGCGISDKSTLECPKQNHYIFLHSVPVFLSLDQVRSHRELVWWVVVLLHYMVPWIQNLCLVHHNGCGTKKKTWHRCAQRVAKSLWWMIATKLKIRVEDASPDYVQQTYVDY